MTKERTGALTLLACCMALICSLILMFWVKKSFFWASWPLKIEQKCPKTLVTNYLPKACNVPQEQRPKLYCGSVKSQKTELAQLGFQWQALTMMNLWILYQYGYSN